MSTRDSTILFSIRSKEYKYLSNDYILPMYINSLEYYHVTGFILSQKFLDTMINLAIVSENYHLLLCAGRYHWRVL